MPTPQPHAHKAEIASRAWDEARAMTGTAPVHIRGACGELTAAALKAYGALSAGTGQHVPFTGLGLGADGMRGLAVFLTVYATEREEQERQLVRVHR
ncbi:hypothetical protein [Streptomyces sp. BA2]|uniref:hypothetical protein n=1 Tax=Streptomyces sp. BA2 TaxID=436595 RepID=UPI00132C83BB|nr:hypothetical protein [Streptomyces sp. BA2]MWA07987.1 hypothetical protein [Streptomyces sp. BA2]